MNINDTILDEINESVRLLLAESALAHVETGRRATVTLKLTVSRDKDTQKRQVRGRVSAVIPEGADDSRTRKSEPLLLLSVTDEIPGQQRIDE